MFSLNCSKIIALLISLYRYFQPQSTLPDVKEAAEMKLGVPTVLCSKIFYMMKRKLALTKIYFYTVIATPFKIMIKYMYTVYQCIERMAVTRTIKGVIYDCTSRVESRYISVCDCQK